MIFEYTRRSGALSASGDRTFQVARLSRHPSSSDAIDVSHLIDRTYDYQSSRELRWHLAERFGLSPSVIALHEQR